MTRKKIVAGACGAIAAGLVAVLVLRAFFPAAKPPSSQSLEEAASPLVQSIATGLKPGDGFRDVHGLIMRSSVRTSNDTERPYEGEVWMHFYWTGPAGYESMDRTVIYDWSTSLDKWCIRSSPGMFR